MAIKACTFPTLDAFRNIYDESQCYSLALAGPCALIPLWDNPRRFETL